MKNIDDLIEILLNNGEIKLDIKVIANSKANSIEFLEDIIKIKITAQAIEGKANKAIVEYLSKITKTPKSKIKILRGEKASLKTIQIIK